jgi:formate dehydrogenase accessory protein FdhE
VNRFERRAERARALATRYPASAEALLFFAKVSEFQRRKGTIDELRALVLPVAPPDDWFNRVMAEMEQPIQPDSVHDNECPHCGAPPQLGVLRPQGDGSALYLACAVCRHEWPFRRTICPGCGEEGKLAFYSADAFPALATLTCDSCKCYLHLIDIAKDIHAVPEADEVAAQPMDAWAMEQGYSKIVQNLVGL